MSDQEVGIPEQISDQQISEEQIYRETVRGVTSCMGWYQVPEFESSASSQDDNPFAIPRSQQWVKYLYNNGTRCLSLKVQPPLKMITLLPFREVSSG